VFPPPPAPAAPPAPPAAAGSTEPKKIHTLTIRTNQPAATNIDPAAQSAAPAARAPASTAPRTAPAPKPSANAPLSLVPGSQSSAAPAPTRTQVARAEPANAPLETTPSAATPAHAGSYSVQVSSQRSEAEAESSFKELQAKYPGQLGSHHANIRRADLGEKGTFYRAMVGPFGSAEAAASMCSSLKAAGGSCIVQRN
jgi:cell division protein FtsN